MFLLHFINIFVLYNCVLHHKFKRCSESGFCTRLLNRNVEESRFIHDHLVCKEGSVKAVLYDKIFNATLTLNVQALKSSRIRIYMTEVDPKYTRYDVFKDTWKDIQSEPEIDKDVKIKHVNNSYCQIDMINSNKLILVSFNPLLIEITDMKYNKIISINKNNGLFIEPHIQNIDIDGTLSNIPPESFDGHTDNLVRGYQGVSADVIFHKFKHVYGIPEHADTFSLNTSDSLYRLFNLDVFEYELYNQMALYGSIPYMVGKNSERTIGMLFLNAAEMWISINKKSTSPLLSFFTQSEPDIYTKWISESGNIDLIFMLGDLPNEVSYQYSLTTGFPTLPPLFSIAYHQCRWNYNDQNDLLDVDSNFDLYNIPYDIIWLDIEHTPHRQYFLFDRSKFPDPHQMMQILSNKGRKLVTVVDPHVKKNDDYFVYKEAIEKGYVTKRSDNSSAYVGWCWPGDSVYPDYLKNDVREWYSTLFSLDKYKDSTVDVHTWVDMNEPSVFNGPEVTVPKDILHGQWENREIHNIYGQMCIEAAYRGGLKRSSNKLRPFVLSRSFFAGSQKYGAIWTGDNLADWSHLKITTAMLLSISISGVPFVGADVAGFFSNPDSELFLRWYQVASMHPFFRGHAHIDTKRREPWSYGSPTTELIREQIYRRYKYLPYIYTYFYISSIYGSPVMRPLWFEFPDDERTFSIEDSFMIGSALLIHPIFEPGSKQINSYFPNNPNNETYWWNVVDGKKYISATNHKIYYNDMKDLPLFQKSSTIVPTWERRRSSSAKMHNDPITLTIVLDKNAYASGSLYLDDGATFDYFTKQLYSFYTFTYYQNRFIAKCTGMYSTKIWLEKIIIHGIEGVSFTRALLKFQNQQNDLILEHINSNSITIRKPGIKLNQNFSIELL